MTTAAPLCPILRRTGLACVLVSVCARVVTTYDPLPGWSLDPLTTAAPHNGLGPAQSVMLSGLAVLGLTFVLGAAWRARERVPGLFLGLAALGLIPVAWHGWLGPTACVENAATGLAWAGAIAAGLAACVACRHPAERGLAVACCAGLAGPMVIRAAVQVYVEHPVLVDDFRANREAFLASHGWSPDSAMARSFERRLSQPDASAWFAMSNVYASVMAGCVAVFAAGCLDAVRAKLWTTGERRDLYRLVGLGLGLACALGGMFLALPAGGSLPKGAVAAMGLGLGLLGLAVWWSGSTPENNNDDSGAGCAARVAGLTRRAAPLLGPGLILMALLAVGLRGMLGERLGELSLLFRAYYDQAALRIFGAHPLWGVGPDGFQAAYLLAKNPLSPEEVSSPHSVLLDYLSTLGVLGLAWCGVLVAMASRTGRTLLGRTEAPAPDPHPWRWLMAVVAAGVLASFWFEVVPLARSAPSAFELLLLDGGTKLAAGGLLWLGLGAAVLWVSAGRLARGAAAGALAVLAHAQIELTGTDVASCGWFLALLGAAAAQPATPAGNPEDGHRSPPRVVAPMGVVGCGLVAAAALVASVPIASWQAELRATAAFASVPATFEQRAGLLTVGGTDDTPGELLADLSGALGRPVEATPDGFSAAMAELRRDRLAQVAERLDALARASSTPSRAVTHTAIGVRQADASLRAGLGADPVPAAGATLELAGWATEAWPADTRLWRDLAQATRLAADLAPELLGEDPAGADTPPLLRAAALDPRSPHLAAQIALRLWALGRSEDAAAWASRALTNHELRRLDPLAGLSENQVQRLRELLGNP